MARTRKSRWYIGLVTVLAAGAAIWWVRGLATDDSAVTEGEPAPAVVSPPQVVPAAPQEEAASQMPAPTVAQAGQATAVEPAAATSEPVADDGAGTALREAKAAIAAGNPIQARRALNAALNPTANSPGNDQVVAELVKIADDTLFSSRILQNDPLVLKHVVATGDNLQKLANTYKITVPLIARINNITNPNAIRQGQPLKVVCGPFHAVVSKGTYRIYIYCQDTLAAVYPVALGAEDSTPTGTWRLKNKLPNPTYYDPRGGSVVSADDPNNPLGEYWMALEGVEGNAVGQERYGIHGTNEPQSIGKSVSLGCIRLRNEDAARVYEMLVVRDSVVTVKE